MKGPLPLLVIVGAVFLAYKYVPFEDIVARFQAPAEAPAAARPDDTAATADTDHDVAAPAAQTTAPVDAPPQAPVTAVRDEAAPAVVEPPPARTQATPPADTATAERSAPPPAAAPVADTPAVDRVPPTRVAALDRPGRIVSDTPPVHRPAPRPKADTPVARVPAAAGPIGRVEPPVATVPQAPPAPPAPPALRILVEADTGGDAGLDAYRPTQYAAMLRQELITVARAHLGANGVSASLGNMVFREALADGRPGIEGLCRRAGSERLLLADLTVPVVFSSIPSAHWPEIEFTAINCRDGRLHKSQSKRLEPSNADDFEYQHGFAQQSQRFIASQAYFLRR